VVRPTRTRTSGRGLAAVAALLLGIAAPAAAGDKTDIVVMTNGDHVTAEIKGLDRGRLTLKTDPMGTVTVYWSDVASVTSHHTFEIEVASGVLYYGSLTPGGPGAVVITGLLGGDTALQLVEVVRISPLGESFWNRIDGRVDLGFSFAQASQQTQWTLNANANYRARRYLNTATLSSQFTAFKDAPSTSRNQLNLSSRRYFRRRWFTAGFGQFQQDESLGLNFRGVIGAAVGRYMVQRRDVTMSVFVGGGYTREQFVDEPGDNSAEALLGTDVEWFPPGEGDTDLSSTVLSFYNLSGRARARVEMNTALEHKFLKDLYWSINVFDSFDSSPPSEDLHNDFGLSLTLGYSF
jgi:hypothetical protein